MNNERDPFGPGTRQGERENCRSTVWAWLIFAGPVWGKLLWYEHWQWVTVPLMLLGIWKTTGWVMQVMALVCVGLVLKGPLAVMVPAVSVETAIAVSYWAVAWYIRWYVDGQAYNRKMVWLSRESSDRLRIDWPKGMSESRKAWWLVSCLISTMAASRNRG